MPLTGDILIVLGQQHVVLEIALEEPVERAVGHKPGVDLAAASARFGQLLLLQHVRRDGRIPHKARQRIRLAGDARQYVALGRGIQTVGHRRLGQPHGLCRADRDAADRKLREHGIVRVRLRAEKTDRKQHGG